MKKLMLLTGGLVLTLGITVAAARTIDVWGQMFTIEDAHPMTVDVGVLTDSSGHHRMNYIRLKNGHLMAVVPMDEYQSFGRMTPSDDMMQ